MNRIVLLALACAACSPSDPSYTGTHLWLSPVNGDEENLELTTVQPSGY